MHVMPNGHLVGGGGGHPCWQLDCKVLHMQLHHSTRALEASGEGLAAAACLPQHGCTHPCMLHAHTPQEEAYQLSSRHGHALHPERSSDECPFPWAGVGYVR